MPDIGGFQHHTRNLHGRPQIDKVAIVRCLYASNPGCHQYSYPLSESTQFLSAVRNQPACRVVLLLSL